MKEKAQHLIEFRSTYLLKWPSSSLHFLGKKEQLQQKITLVLHFTYILHSSHVRTSKSPIYYKLLWPAPCGVSTTHKKASWNVRRPKVGSFFQFKGLDATRFLFLSVFILEETICVNSVLAKLSASFKNVFSCFAMYYHEFVSYDPRLISFLLSEQDCRKDYTVSQQSIFFESTRSRPLTKCRCLPHKKSLSHNLYLRLESANGWQTGHVLMHEQITFTYVWHNAVKFSLTFILGLSLTFPFHQKQLIN